MVRCSSSVSPSFFLCVCVCVCVRESETMTWVDPHISLHPLSSLSCYLLLFRQTGEHGEQCFSLSNHALTQHRGGRGVCVCVCVSVSALQLSIGSGNKNVRPLLCPLLTVHQSGGRMEGGEEEEEEVKVRVEERKERLQIEEGIRKIF